MRASKILILLVIAGLIGAYFAFDLGQYLNLAYFKSQQAAIDEFFQANPWLTVGIYAAIYIVVTALSLPGAAVMTLVGGAIFGLLLGTIIVSFASTIGATLAFLVARFLLRDMVQRRFGDSLRSVNAGVRRDGALYLFMLRLVPAFPFFVINLVMALTPIRTLTFFVVSQIGMLAGTIVYVNAGTQLAQIESLGGILSPELIGAFVLLGIFPFIARFIVRLIKRRRALRGWDKPAAFDRNLVVIGAGSAGLVSAYIAAAVKARVTLIEKDRMGGDCLNTGCVPSKALIRSARFLSHVRRHEEFGVHTATADFRFADVMERVHDVIRKIEPHDSVERYQGLGVEVIQGEARITGPWTVEVNGRTLTTRHIVVAAGARPFVPPIPGVEDIDYYTSDTIWGLREQPGRLLVLGGGPIGCELAQAFARLGSRVTQVEMLPRIMAVEDEDIGAFVSERLASEGVDIRTGHKATAFRREDGEQVLLCEHGGEEVRIPFDAALIAVGRKARVGDYGLDTLGIGLTERGTIDVDEYLQTRIPTIHACGDCVGPYQFTHAAAHQAWHATVNSLFGAFKRFRVDYRVLPHATFTDPEVARVGLSEDEARREQVEYEVTRYDISDLDRAIAEGEAHGVVKVLTVPGKDRILGATIVGEHAGDLIAEFALAMKKKAGLNTILGTVHAYPTLAEANKFAAGEWKRAHAPAGILALLQRFHGWLRGTGDSGGATADEAKP
ncbi:MAG: FAD-dependent oxidoreductase [Halofilum sp. (in: g-proteobacteria)]|nr:FAD-dependent oxidoreductase [Halofilum sp. (in: g-proteobacteria)]